MMVPNGEWAERGGRKTPERPFVTLDDNGHMMFENHRKSLIQYCERSEHRFQFDWTKVKNSHASCLKT